MHNTNAFCDDHHDIIITTMADTLFSSLQCFTPADYKNFTGYETSQPLNVTEFQKIAPVLVFYLVPEKNSGHDSSAVCKPLPEKLFETLVRNYSGHGAKGITEEALDKILEQINATFGKYLHGKKASCPKKSTNKECLFFLVLGEGLC